MNEIKDKTVAGPQAEADELLECEACECIATALHRDENSLRLVCDSHSQEYLEEGKMGQLIARCSEGWVETPGGYYCPANPDVVESTMRTKDYKPSAFRLISGVLVVFPGDPQITAVKVVGLYDILLRGAKAAQEDNRGPATDE